VKDASGRSEELLARISAAHGSESRLHGDAVVFSEVLGRRIRAGDWSDQQISTYDKVRQALEEGNFALAAELGDFFADEAAIIYDIYRGWVPPLIDYLRDRGLSEEELTALNERILALLTLPDGRAFNARQQWAEFQERIRNFLLRCGAGQKAEALSAFEEAWDHWRRQHDRDVDHIYGLLNEIVVRFGESELETTWNEIIGDLFSTRYAKFDLAQYSWEDSLWTNLYLVMEAMRGHLVGPGRKGRFEFTEDEDRYTFRFDPCGSGGHTLRGDDEVEGTPSRMEPPYGWGVTTEEHDWAWNLKGVCYYCTDCCVVMQLKPIDEYGYPVRVVEPPTYPADARAKCTWHVYKDPAKVPERYYRAVGREKPEQLRRPEE
jgi:hypothetical protein